MKEKGIDPTASSYAALLCGFAKAGDIGKIRETINQCEKEEVYLLDKDYMDIIFALAMNGHEKHVDEFIAKMKKYAGYNQDIVNLVYRYFEIFFFFSENILIQILYLFSGC